MLAFWSYAGVAQLEWIPRERQKLGVIQRRTSADRCSQASAQAVISFHGATVYFYSCCAMQASEVTTACS